MMIEILLVASGLLLTISVVIYGILVVMGGDSGNVND